MKNIIKLILIGIVIVSIVIYSWTRFNDSCRLNHLDDISDETIELEFEKLYGNVVKSSKVNAEIVSYKVETIEENRRLKIIYKTNYLESEERELLDETSAIYDKIKANKMMNKYIDRIWILAFNDGEYVINRSLTVIKTLDKYIIKIIVSLMMAFTITTTLIARRVYYDCKRNSKLGGEDISDYSLEELNAYVAKSKYDDEAFMHIALMLNNNGRNKEAKTRIERAILLNPKNLSYKRIAGKIVYNIGEYKLAIKYYKGSQGLYTMKKDYDYYFNIGKAYIKNGEMKKGNSSIDKAKKIVAVLYETNIVKQKMIMDNINKFEKSIRF